MRHTVPSLTWNLAFAEFAAPCASAIINGDQQATATFARTLAMPIRTFGFSSTADLRLIRSHRGEHAWTFDPQGFDENRFTIPASVSGEHNFLNAAGALLLAHSVVNKPLHELARPLASFQTLGRRLEAICTTSNGTVVIDDYAHHPAHLTAAASTLREIWPGRHIVCYFQPSNYRRTATMIVEYVNALSNFDSVVIDETTAGTFDDATLKHTGSSAYLHARLHAEGVIAHLGGTDCAAHWIGSLSKNSAVAVVCGARRSGGEVRRLARMLA